MPEFLKKCNSLEKKKKGEKKRFLKKRERKKGTSLENKKTKNFPIGGKSVSFVIRFRLAYLDS